MRDGVDGLRARRGLLISSVQSEREDGFLSILSPEPVRLRLWLRRSAGTGGPRLESRSELMTEMVSVMALGTGAGDASGMGCENHPDAKTITVERPLARWICPIDKDKGEKREPGCRTESTGPSTGWNDAPPPACKHCGKAAVKTDGGTSVQKSCGDPKCARIIS